VNILTADLTNKKDLIYILVKRQIRQKHVGSLLGYFWSFYAALLPVVSYVLVFFFIAKIRPPGVQGPWEYFLFVFSGILPWLFFSKIATEGSDLINSNLDILKQAIFPVEILSVVSATENLVNFFIQLCLFMIFFALSAKLITLKLLLLPVFILLLYLFCLGISWLFSILGYFLRDLKDIVSSSLQFLIFLTPVVYTKDQIPAAAHWVFDLNPITHVIQSLRDILYNDRIQNPESMVIFATLSLITFFLGLLAINKVKKSIGDMV